MYTGGTDGQRMMLCEASSIVPGVEGVCTNRMFSVVIALGVPPRVKRDGWALPGVDMQISRSVPAMMIFEQFHGRCCLSHQVWTNRVGMCYP